MRKRVNKVDEAFSRMGPYDKQTIQDHLTTTALITFGIGLLCGLAIGLFYM